MIAASVWYRAVARLARTWASLLAGALLLSGAGLSAQAQAPPAWLQPLASFPLTGALPDSLTIRQHAESLKPFTVAGKCGAFVGQQDGSFEAWTWPIKLLSHFRITAELKDYTVPIDVNDQAAEIEVAPDHTTITYAHAAFTIREILFATPCDTNGAGVMALFQINSVRPLTLTFNFTPEMKQMWPAANYNAPSPEWVSLNAAPVSGAQAGSEQAQDPGGYYLLHTDSDALSGAIAMPNTEPGILAPYQERPKTWPLQLILHYNPTLDGAKYFPLLMAAGNTAQTASKAALVTEIETLGSRAAELYRSNLDYYGHFFDTRLTAETPDVRLNQALQWAELSIDQLRVQHGAEVALVAGLYSSGDSNRPGFGWFFGRDALYTLFAVDSYGDFALTREELNFLLKRQRTDGKIMHEYSQTAELVDWKDLPYEYAAADATPLFLMAVEDYVNASGDTAWLNEHWAAVEKAYSFESTHDTDGDGIYDNAQGTGWVESWPIGMPHQEIYLAALDQQGTAAYARLAVETQHSASAAETRAKAVAETLQREYAPASANTGMYAFSRNKDGSLDTTATIYPSVAWFDGDYALPHPDTMFHRWASHEFSTDWGTRDLGEHERFYDPISYHQGSVWPLFTGWASLAEYRTGRSLSGYAHLMQNADMTWSQDLGAVTELLSGDTFAPFGRSTTHQLWSSAMVLTPAIRGLFGVTVHGDTITVDPHLPADWGDATLRHVPTGSGGRATLVYRRQGSSMTVRLEAEEGAKLPELAGSRGARAKNGVLSFPLPGAEIVIPSVLPLPGASTAQLKVLEQGTGEKSATWTLEALGGSIYRLPLRLNGVKSAHISGAELVKVSLAESTGGSFAEEKQGAGSAPPLPDMLTVRFPSGPGYTSQVVTVTW